MSTLSLGSLITHFYQGKKKAELHPLSTLVHTPTIEHYLLFLRFDSFESIAGVIESYLEESFGVLVNNLLSDFWWIIETPPITLTAPSGASFLKITELCT
jgi:hypothetical protein